MPRTTKFAETLIDWVESRIGNALLQPLWLGGAPGPSGGSGGRQFDGQLTQGEVTFDTSEAESQCYPVGGKSLVHNLDRMRAWLAPARWFGAETLASGLKLSVRAGLWYPSGVMLGVFEGAESPVFALPNTNQRIDTLYLDIDNNLQIQQGTESANPTITIPTAQYTLPLWAIRLTPTSENIRWSGCSGWWDGDGYITKDLRPFFNLGGGGASVFTALSDTPNNYTGDADKVVVVTTEEDGLTFTDYAGDFISLTDTPTTYSGESEKFLRVKSTEDQIEFTTTAAGDHNHTAPGDGGTLTNSVVDIYLDWDIIGGAAPASPAVGFLRMYGHSSNIKVKDEDGLVLTLGGDHNHTAENDGGTLSGSIVDTYLDFEIGDAPAVPSGGYLRIYTKNDNKMYQKESDGTETVLTGGGDGNGGAADPVKFWVTAVGGDKQAGEVGTPIVMQRIEGLMLEDAEVCRAVGQFIIPSGFGSSTKVKAVAIPDATGNVYASTSIYYGQCDEDKNQHTATAGPTAIAITASKRNCIQEITLSNAAEGDLVSITFTRTATDALDTVNDLVYFPGWIVLPS